MISYRLEHHPRSQNIKIKIMPDGEVVVVAPRICPTFLINRFVESKHDWIEEHVEKMKKAVKGLPKQDPNTVMIFGKSYKKEVNEDLRSKIGVKISGDSIIITPVTFSATSVEKSLTTFLKKTAEKYIVPRTQQLAKKMSISYGNITLRNQKTRWGSCSSDGNLNFNWRLIHSPTEVIDYVIIHELAHRKEMNHSKHFWAIVEKYDPEHLKHRGWLKRQGMVLS